MELDYYKNFITIVETGTITGAAEKIGIAQSGLSKEIQNLETMYSTTLINKAKRGSKVSLTDAGKVFYETAKVLCSIENNMKQEILNCNSGYRGTLSITVSPALSERLARNKLAAFHKMYKEVSFMLKEASSSEQEAFLLNNIVEIGITNSPIPHPYEFDVIKAVEQKYYVFTNKKNSFLDLAKPYFTLQDLANVPLCLSQSSCQTVIDSLANKNIPFNILSRFSHRRTTLAWVDEGFGVAVFPTTEEYLANDNIQAIPLELEGAAPKQMVYKVKGKELSFLTERFIAEQILK